jgi:hypothetical protein
MGDDGGRMRWYGPAAAVVLGAVALVSARVEAQSLRSDVQVQYLHVDGARFSEPYETWGKSIGVNWSKQTRGLALSSRLRFFEQTVVSQKTRARSPEGDLGLSHRYFSLSTRYLPTESRDETGLISRQQVLSLNSRVQVPWLPGLSGSWVRSHTSPNDRAPVGRATISRSLSASQEVGRFSLRAGVGDRGFHLDGEPLQTTSTYANFGAVTRFQLGSLPLLAGYDFAQSRGNLGAVQPLTSRTHLGRISGNFAASPRTNAGLDYSFQRNEVRSASSSQSNQHAATLSVAHALSSAISLSGNVGVRAATFGNQTRTENFLAASASAQGRVRPGWLVSSSASHAQTWLPGEQTRPSESVSAATTLGLSPRFSVRADMGVSTARIAVTASETRRDFSAQSGAGVSATPLRTLFFEGQVRRSQNGGSFLRGGQISTTYSSQVRLAPTPQFMATVQNSVRQAETGRGTTLQTSLSWRVASTFQFAGSYNRARQQSGSPGQPQARQESYSANVNAALGWRLTSSFQYSESNPHQPSHVRQYGFSVGRPFGR